MAKTILLVDDDQELATIQTIVLQREGYHVVTARDGEEALEKVRACAPDLVVADLLLPKLDGWRVCQQLKGDPRFRHIPVILLSGLLEERSGQEEAYLGDASLPKPCTPENLLRTIRTLLPNP